MEYTKRSHYRCFSPSIIIYSRLSARAPAVLAVIFVGTPCNIFVLSIDSQYLNNNKLFCDSSFEAIYCIKCKLFIQVSAII